MTIANNLPECGDTLTTADGVRGTVFSLFKKLGRRTFYIIETTDGNLYSVNADTLLIEKKLS